MKNEKQSTSKKNTNKSEQLSNTNDVEQEDTADLDIDESSGGSGSTETGLDSFGNKVDMDQEDNNN